jgi:hypothetical protein
MTLPGMGLAEHHQAKIQWGFEGVMTSKAVFRIKFLFF